MRAEGGGGYKLGGRSSVLDASAISRAFSLPV